MFKYAAIKVEITSVNVEPKAGASIEVAFAELVDLASRLDQPMYMDFNAEPVVAYPNDPVEAVIERWRKGSGS